MIADTTEAQFDALVNVHFKGVFFLTQTLLPLLAGGGRIVNLSSGLTRVSTPGFAAYSAAKGAVEVLSVYLAKELGARGIAVNTVAPGAIETDFLGGAVRDTPDLNQQFADMTALGRVGQPDDIGPMIANLFSEDNRWINAQRIEVSGGQGICTAEKEHGGKPSIGGCLAWQDHRNSPSPAAAVLIFRDFRAVIGRTGRRAEYHPAPRQCLVMRSRDAGRSLGPASLR